VPAVPGRRRGPRPLRVSHAHGLAPGGPGRRWSLRAINRSSKSRWRDLQATLTPPPTGPRAPHAREVKLSPSPASHPPTPLPLQQLRRHRPVRGVPPLSSSSTDQDPATQPSRALRRGSSTPPGIVALCLRAFRSAVDTSAPSHARRLTTLSCVCSDTRLSGVAPSTFPSKCPLLAKPERGSPLRRRSAPSL
jgi:hypothetical protein